ncbi:hypothetical protein AWW66_10915 [Micromonospora rosaria]|uniref:Uncharacterized protein n=1 Tax=Micromonospora rosaria TaxID=47874 RepID=A0A136PUC3_9ACTN|nr:hypothetical protein AWW66_10915 [Micromonospora rosaria]
MRVDHERYASEHLSTPVQVLTPTGRTVVRLESTGYRAPMVSVSHWSNLVEPDEPVTSEPDDLLLLDLSSAAEMAAAVVSLIGRELGQPR